MHDPMTVAFKIRWPWFWMKYRPPIVTVWHVDPERDGSDDSCGWSAPRLTKKQRERLKWLGYHEAKEPWIFRDATKRAKSPAEAEAVMRGVVQAAARVLRLRFSWDQICEMACDFVHCPGNNFQMDLCHLPGYHTNFEEDLESEREYRAEQLFYSVGRQLLAKKRWWFQKPRWHVHHWKLQIHAIQSLKRWLFTRCERCGGRFRWGESACTNSWNGTGPLWFRSEKHVHHSNCDGSLDHPVTDTPELQGAK